MEDIKRIFPSKFLKRTFRAGSYAVVNGPVDLIWSKTTRKLGIKFSYTAYTDTRECFFIS
jgi:hypothetical protein